MAVYSHSRISTFEQCPFKYKLQYVDKIEVETLQTIEAFMGSLVHQTLEKMYKDRKFKKKVSKAILLKFFRDLWKKEYSKDILVVKEGLTSENYRKMSEKYKSPSCPLRAVFFIDDKTLFVDGEKLFFLKKKIININKLIIRIKEFEDDTK